jgi:DNA invertase Pin-like site-specific DNA recombinase
VALQLLDLNGDISSKSLSKLFLTIAAAFAEAERDRIRERIGRIKADHRARGRYLGGIVPFGFRCGESGDLGRTARDLHAWQEPPRPACAAEPSPMPFALRRERAEP